jgi:hypothetical protein
LLRRDGGVAVATEPGGDPKRIDFFDRAFFDRAASFLAEHRHGGYSIN